MATQQVNERLAALTAAGTSVWLDQIGRQLIESGELRRLVEEDSLRGVTSNPTIFNQAILGAPDYDDQLGQLAREGKSTREIYQALAIQDIQAGCDVLRPVYDETGGYDGYVSFEVDPDLAFDTEKTMEQAREYWQRVDRPNLMIKIPGTDEGTPAIEEMIYEGLNINVTLLFSVAAYERVAEAFIRGLERRLEEGKSVDMQSVASFFVSRVDSEVDKRLEAAGNTELLGRAGLANARAAYRRFKAIFHGDRFAKLREAGASVQRPLWASTGVKNPRYPDTMYVDGLVGPETVNTMPMATLLAAADHANIEGNTVEIDPEPDLRALAEAGIDLDEVTAKLLSDGIDKFVEPMDKLLEGLDEKREAIVTSRPPTIRADIPDDLEPRIAERVRKAMVEDVAHRIWKKDDTLWGPAGQAEVSNRLGWLTIVDTMSEAVDDLEAFAAEIRDEGFQDVVLLGMGGSSLAPEVIRLSFGDREGWPALHVLDSTDAGAIRAVRDGVDLEKTLFLVSTKSGGTIETLSLFKAFWALRPEGRQYVAITDPGSGLADLAAEHGFRRTFLNDPDIGGRYSALSYFGLVPAALMGADVRGLLDRAGVAEQNCLTFDSSNTNSGLWLGLAWGELALAGRDKLTYVVDPPLQSFGLWVEQLIAESTGKHGKGIVPIVGEPLGEPGGLRRRPHVPLPAPRRRAQPRPRRQDRGAGEGRPPGHHPDHPRADRPRPPVLLRRVRHRRRRVGARDQPLRPAQRAGGQGRHEPRPEGGRHRSARRGRRRPARAGDRPRRAALPGDHGLRRAVGGGRRGRDRAAHGRARRHALGDDLRLRPALPALDRPAAQGRSADRAASCSSSTTPSPTSRSRAPPTASPASSTPRRSATSRRSARTSCPRSASRSTATTRRPASAR